jgi:hypothetical protein
MRGLIKEDKETAIALKETATSLGYTILAIYLSGFVGQNNCIAIVTVVPQPVYTAGQRAGHCVLYGTFKKKIRLRTANAMTR